MNDPSMPFCVGASPELTRISESSNPRWRQFYTILPETNLGVRKIPWDTSGTSTSQNLW